MTEGPIHAKTPMSFLYNHAVRAGMVLLLGFLTVVAYVAVPARVDAATITGITPSVVVPGTTEVTVTGSGFGAYDSAGDQVCFNKLEGGYAVAWFCSLLGTIDVTSWNDTTIVFKAPSDPNGAMIAGKIHVNVDYTLVDGPYYHVQPVIAAVSPSTSFAGGKVRLTGMYFIDALGSPQYYQLKVLFNGVEGTVAQADWTSTEITATVPSGATTGSVSVVLEAVDGSASVSGTGPDVTILTGTTDDPLSALQQYLKQIGVDRAWAAAGSGKSPIVAVIDDGVYINHPELRNRIWINTKERIGNGKDDDRNGYVDDVYGFNFVLNTPEMTAYDTHGTMVAGIIAAETDNAEGVTGINERVRLMPLTVCDAQLGCPFKAISKAIRYAVDNGARIINLSLSTRATTGYTTEINSAIKYAYANNVMLVAASGNGDVEGGIGQDLNIIPQSPVCNDLGKNMIVGVGAVDDGGSLTAWSNFGSKCVDTYAPGVDIVTTAVPMYNDLIPGGFYGYGSGTSFAAPMVSGILSLLLEKYPHMSADEAVSRLRRYSPGGVVDAYGLIAAPYDPPVITKVSPSTIQGAALRGDRTLTITGRNFTKKTSVRVAGTKVKVKYVSKKKLIVILPLGQFKYGKHVLTAYNTTDRVASMWRWLTLKK